MGFLTRRFSGKRRTAAQIPDGMRVYAVGDIHGEAILLDRLLGKIEDDLVGRVPKPITLIFLGDLIDRGPDSLVILRSMMNASERGAVILKGNHEQALIDSYRGDDAALGFWMEYGGLETLLSFGIDPAGLDCAGLREAMHMRIDPGIIDWLDSRPTSHCLGDYFFVHAGIRPGVALDDQTEEDMLWIREPFLGSRRDHGKVIVHGHTVIPGPVELGGNRICLDTGGHEYGQLTALGLEGTDQWVVEVSEPR